MSLTSQRLRRFARRALVDASGVPSPGTAQLADAFDTLCRGLHKQLQPLFGTPAVDALFARTLHVATTEFPWLAEVLPNGLHPSVVDRAAALGTAGADHLEEGLAAVLAGNIGLLSEFVGDDVVLPLVEQAWGIVATATHETEGEQ